MKKVYKMDKFYSTKKLEESMKFATTPQEVSEAMANLLRNNIKGSIKISGGAKFVITPEFQDEKRASLEPRVKKELIKISYEELNRRAEKKRMEEEWKRLS